MRTAIATAIALIAITIAGGTADARPPARVLVIGDSIAHGYSANIKAEHRVVNRSIPGSCLFLMAKCPNRETRPLMNRLRATVIRPGDIVVISIGTNDLLHGKARQYTAAYRKAVRYVQKRDAHPMVATITPFGGELLWDRPEMNERRVKVNAWITKHMPVVDLSATLGGDHMPPRFDSGDGLHPNPAGSRALGRAVTSAIREWRAEPPA